MKKVFAILLISAFSLVTLNSYAAAKVVEKIVAIVNNNVILNSEVESMLKNVKGSTDPSALPDDETLRHQILDRLVIDSLILQEAAKMNINVTQQEVNDAITGIAKQNGMTVNELRTYLSSLGINFTEYRERIRNDMIIDDVRMGVVRQRIMISDKEVSDLAKTIAAQPADNRSVNLSHILIALPDNPTKKQIDDATAKANNIIKRLNSGESFAKLAASYSKDDYALKGGNMGWHQLNELPSIFEERLVRAQKGDVVGPLRSGVGLHILKVDDIKAAAQPKTTIQEVDAKHILIKTNVLTSDQMAKDKLLALRQAILNGSITFESAAKKDSDDIGSAENGGNLGWSNPDRYDPSFKDALLKLKKGDISQPIKSAFGWHLIQLNDKRTVDGTQAIQKDQAYRLIFNRKFSEELQVWVQELKSDAYINIIDDKINE